MDCDAKNIIGKMEYWDTSNRSVKSTRFLLLNTCCRR